MIDLRSAVKVYEVLAPYLPTVMEEDTVTEYAHKLLQNMKEKPSDVVKLLELMTGYTSDELLNMIPSDLYEMFVREIVENKILQLQDFMEGFGYGNA